jgi:hypothetical protein
MQKFYIFKILFCRFTIFQKEGSLWRGCQTSCISRQLFLTKILLIFPDLYVRLKVDKGGQWRRGGSGKERKWERRGEVEIEGEIEWKGS